MYEIQGQARGKNGSEDFFFHRPELEHELEPETVTYIYTRVGYLGQVSIYLTSGRCLELGTTCTVETWMAVMIMVTRGMAMSKLAIATLFVLALLGLAVCDNTDDTCATPGTCSDMALFPGRGAALIGHTGYVGSNLLRQAKYDGVFNSKNIHEIGEQHWSMVVCAGAPGFKIGANVLKKTLSGMDYSDTTAMTSLINDLSRVRTDFFVLISVTTITAPPRRPVTAPRYTAHSLTHSRM